jgi:hypothetical protein
MLVSRYCVLTVAMQFCLLIAFFMHLMRTVSNEFVDDYSCLIFVFMCVASSLFCKCSLILAINCSTTEVSLTLYWKTLFRKRNKTPCEVEPGLNYASSIYRQAGRQAGTLVVLETLPNKSTPSPM